MSSPIPSRALCSLLLIGTFFVTGCSSTVPGRFNLHIDRGLEGDLEAGTAVTNVTPAADARLYMAGFSTNKRMEGVKHKLEVRALALRRGDFTSVLVSIPFVGFMQPDVHRTLEGIEGVDPNNVIIASTHSHSAPDTLGMWGKPLCLVTGKNKAYMETVRGKIREAIGKAIANLQPAEVGYGEVEVDSTKIYSNKNIQGQIDPVLTTFHLRKPGDGLAIATLFSFACHPEVGRSWNKMVTPDFPHYAIKMVETELGGTAIYVSGALGAMQSPALGKKPDDVTPEDHMWNEMDRIGRHVGTNALIAVSNITDNAYSSEPILGAWRRPIFVKNNNWILGIAHCFKLFEHTRYCGGYHESEVNLWRIGDYRMAGIPGEASPDLGFRIKASSGGKGTMLVGLANDEMGYLLPYSEQPLPYYAYERTFNLSREAGEVVCTSLEMLGRMSNYTKPEKSPWQEDTKRKSSGSCCMQHIKKFIGL